MGINGAEIFKPDFIRIVSSENVGKILLAPRLSSIHGAGVCGLFVYSYGVYIRGVCMKGTKKASPRDRARGLANLPAAVHTAHGSSFSSFVFAFASFSLASFFSLSFYLFLFLPYSSCSPCPPLLSLFLSPWTVSDRGERALHWRCQPGGGVEKKGLKVEGEKRGRFIAHGNAKHLWNNLKPLRVK